MDGHLESKCKTNTKEEYEKNRGIQNMQNSSNIFSTPHIPPVRDGFLVVVLYKFANTSDYDALDSSLKVAVRSEFGPLIPSNHSKIHYSIISDLEHRRQLVQENLLGLLSSFSND